MMSNVGFLKSFCCPYFKPRENYLSFWFPKLNHTTMSLFDLTISCSSNDNMTFRINISEAPTQAGGSAFVKPYFQP